MARSWESRRFFVQNVVRNPICLCLQGGLPRASAELGEGVFLIIFGTLGIIFGALRIKIGAQVAGILSFILCCYEMYNMAIIYEELGGLSGLISRGAGFYLLILSSIALLVLSILNFVFKK